MAAFVNIFTENLKYLNLVFFLILIDNTEILKCLVNIKINSYLMKVVHKRQKNHRLYLSCQYLIKYKKTNQHGCLQVKFVVKLGAVNNALPKKTKCGFTNS